MIDWRRARSVRRHHHQKNKGGAGVVPDAMKKTGRRDTSFPCPKAMLLVSKSEDSEPIKNDVDLVVSIVCVGML